MVGPAGEDETGTIKITETWRWRSVVRAWEQVERERDEGIGKERRTHRIQHLERCKYDQRGHVDIDNLYAKSSNLRRCIDWTENQAYEYGMDADEDIKHNQKYVRKVSQCFMK